MNSTLFIKHLSSKLTTHEREDFLKHFGAHKVWFINKNSNTAFAQFKSIPAAEEALHRLHQLEILGRRLTVEYANDSQLEVPKSNEDTAENSKLKEFVDSLNAWNPSLNFLQPPPSHLVYKYPPQTPLILFNIMDALLSNNSFYTQTLHLMNRMCLDPPFGYVKEDIKRYIKESLHYLDIEIPTIVEPIKTLEPESGNINNKTVSSEESEISSDENVPTIDNANVQIPIKRKSNVKRINKIPKLSTQMNISRTKKSKTPKFKTEDVFEDVSIQESKKIELKLNSTQLPLPSNDVNVEEVGQIGRIHPTNGPEERTSNVAAFVTRRELLDNKISLQDMKVLPIFKNYHPGVPSTKLYIKNLAKDVETIDLERIYKRFIEDCDFSDKQLFDLRLMQEGRMKGQAFVNFPNVDLCERALNETNGFILKSKPMVVQFAKTSK